jgi:hypothetical protein
VSQLLVSPLAQEAHVLIHQESTCLTYAAEPPYIITAEATIYLFIYEMDRRFVFDGEGSDKYLRIASISVALYEYVFWFRVLIIKWS